MSKIISTEDAKVNLETKVFPYAKWKYDKFNPVQSRVIEYYDKDVNGLIASATSSGKAQPDGSLVLTPNGYCLIEELKIGDQIIGGDGKSTKITGIYPQGFKEIFKVNFSDNTSTECCEDHLWTVKHRDSKNKKYNWKTISLKEIREVGCGYFHIPTVGKVEFNHRDLPIHPYLLGILLGDGGLSWGLVVTIANSEILDNVKNCLPKDCSLKYRSKYDYSIVGSGGQYNSLCYYLSQMGLMGLRSYEKSIPFIYKHSSVEQRIDLLKGLMDSDGGCSNSGTPTFDVTSEKLAEDVAFLVRSFGGVTRIRVKNRSTYKYKGEIRNGRKVYRMSMNVGFNPFGHKESNKARFADEYVNKCSRNRLRTISEVKSVGTKNCRCIKVENEDGLYVTNDFIVTHNTTIAEIMLSYEIKVRKKKGLYLVPMRALAQEKIDEWTDKNHHFNDINIAICTGDYRITKERAKELDEADLIIMTSEMLSHRTRSHKSEQNNWIKEIGSCVIDEAHLLTVPGRGDHLEVGLMKFTKINPDVKLVLLSATLPNVEEVAEWVASRLTNRETFVLRSKYRPCNLNIHYETYFDGFKKYDDKENEKVNKALDIIEYYTDDKFLIFAHTKRTGELMIRQLKALGIKSEFHNANLNKEDRISLENRFKKEKEPRIIVATPTLAWGCNLPARRVILLGIHRGLDEVETYNVSQMVGRSGRVGLDPQGDAYILLPESEMNRQKARLQKPQNIISQLLTKVGEQYKVLAFHLVSEIYHGDIQTNDDVHSWFERSLASHQAQLFDDKVVDKTMDLLKNCGAIRQEDGLWKTTVVGQVASLFYYSPFDISDLKKNFTDLFEAGNQDNDYYLSMALGNTDVQRMNIVSKAEKEEMSLYLAKLRTLPGMKFWNDASAKAGYCYYQLLNGNNSSVLAGIQRTFQFDYNRLSQVLMALDSIGCKWGKINWFKNVEQRIAHGVPMYLIGLCAIKDVGKVRATKLWNAGFKTVDQVSDDINGVKRALNCKDDLAKNICENAKIISLTTV